MALPLPQGRQIHIYRRVLSGEFKMDSMEAATDHYSVGFIIHGDRTIITPQITHTSHAGDVQLIAPYLYHKTVPASKEYYESVLIKFSEDFVKPLTDQIGKHILDQIYAFPFKSFMDETAKNKAFQLAWEMLEIYENETAEDINISDFKLQNLLLQMLILIYEKGTSSNAGIMGENVYPFNSPLSPQIMDAVYYIESNYMNTLKIEKAAQIAGYSISYFSRLFQNQLGISFSEYCMDVRLKHTQHALLTSDKSIMDISLEMGFSHPGNLTSCFKKKFGITPLAYRKHSK